MGKALELRSAHWAPRNALARAAGVPEPMPRRRKRHTALADAIGVGIGDPDAPWRTMYVVLGFRARGDA